MPGDSLLLLFFTLAFSLLAYSLIVLGFLCEVVVSVWHDGVKTYCVIFRIAIPRGGGTKFTGKGGGDGIKGGFRNF